MKSSIPNILTASNLFCGCLAVLYVIQGQADMASIMLLVALGMDFLDGFVARMLNVSSPIGKELDSLADMVSFGLVPGLILVRMIADVQEISFVPDQIWTRNSWFLLGFSVVIFSALRLARFNLDERQSDAFYGLPTPANTILILSFWLIVSYWPNHIFAQWINNLPVLVIISLASSYMLIADLRLLSLKFKSFGFRKNIARYLLIAASLLLLGIFQVIGIPLAIFVYILLSLVDNAGVFGTK